MQKKFPPELQAYIISHLRRIGYRNIYYKTAMASAHKGFSEWECAECKGLFKRSELHGDHKICVVDPEVGFVDWNTFMERLFLTEIQPLCKNKCHAEKTKRENERRREVKSKK